MSGHALLSASSASRWMKCTPSARMGSGYPETTSIYAEEGKQAHALAENWLNSWLTGKATLHEPDLTNDMLEAVRYYVDLCIEKINKARAQTPDAKILLEQRLDFSDWVVDGYGTGDLIIVSDGLLEIVDLKFGKGVKVSAENNAQMKLYALGAYSRYGTLYEFDSICMTIVQPRIDALSSEVCRVSELLAWGEEIKPIAQQAFKGEGDFVPGSHCQFCLAKVHCRARAEENMRLVIYDFATADKLEDIEIADILVQADRLQEWAADLQKYALVQAIAGKDWPGWKLVAGRATRKYIDADLVADRLKGAGYPEAILFERKMLGLTAMEKVIGKKKFSELAKDLIITPAGKPALAPESDKRQPIDRKSVTLKDFEEENEDE